MWVVLIEIQEEKQHSQSGVAKSTKKVVAMEDELGGESKVY